MKSTGKALVLVKGVNEDKPFYSGWCEVEKLDNGKWKLRRPKKVYKKGVGGVHYRLLPETYIEENRATKKP